MPSIQQLIQVLLTILVIALVIWVIVVVVDNLDDAEGAIRHIITMAVTPMDVARH